jgi:hypothetical protein
MLYCVIFVNPYTTAIYNLQKWTLSLKTVLARQIRGQILLTFLVSKLTIYSDKLARLVLEKHI